jgi:hypothetical protein
MNTTYAHSMNLDKFTWTKNEFVRIYVNKYKFWWLLMNLYEFYVWIKMDLYELNQFYSHLFEVTWNRRECMWMYVNSYELLIWIYLN